MSEKQKVHPSKAPASSGALACPLGRRIHSTPTPEEAARAMRRYHNTAVIPLDSPAVSWSDRMRDKPRPSDMVAK